MKTTHSILDLIQDEHLLVSQKNDIIAKCKGDINKLTDDERERLIFIRASYQNETLDASVVVCLKHQTMVFLY